MTPQQAYEQCYQNKKTNKYLEKIIINSPSYSYAYAEDVIKGRWTEAEQIILKDVECAYLYVKYVIKNRWQEAENIIVNDPEYACQYAKYIIKGRWVEAENIISADPEWAYWYAQDVIKGKLPEHMHNAMLLHYMNDDLHAKYYFNSKYFTELSNIE